MDRGTAKDRTSTRRRRALVACLLGLLVLPGAAGCGESGEEKAAARARAAAAAAHARSIETGRRVFARHCQSCHTLEGKPYTVRPPVEFEAPNLDQVKPRRGYVEERVDSGGIAMASFANEIPEHGIRGVIDYVMDAAGSEVETEDPPAAQMEAGREVFEQHCSLCHGIAGRRQTGEPLYGGTDFRYVKPSVGFVRERVRKGLPAELAMMPGFADELDDEQIDAVAAYVNAVAGEGPGGSSAPAE